MLIVSSFIYLCLFAFLIYIAYSKRHFKYYTAAKTAASVGFILLSAIAFYVGGGNNPSYFYGLLPCLALCLFGDVYLGLANNKGKLFSKYFLRGVISFMLAHIGFCIVFSFLSPFHAYDLVLPICLLFFTWLCSRSNHFKLHRMKLPVMAYSLFVGLMCARGFSAAFAIASPEKSMLLCIGSVLFLLSDGVILLLYFYLRPRKMLRFLNLATYYIGLLCIALSCAY
ncbi:MAG: lysoplasmalogenase [Oscillospiraceae bacterium]